MKWSGRNLTMVGSIQKINTADISMLSNMCIGRRETNTLTHTYTKFGVRYCFLFALAEEEKEFIRIMKLTGLMKTF